MNKFIAFFSRIIVASELAVVTVSASEKIWIGPPAPGDASWSNSANWSPGGIPSGADEVIINNNLAILDSGTTSSVNSLTVGRGDVGFLTIHGVLSASFLNGSIIGEGGSGTLHVDGAGANFSTPSLFIGNRLNEHAGHGVLTLSNGGKVSVTAEEAVMLGGDGLDLESTGTIHFGSASDHAPVAAGILDVSKVVGLSLGLSLTHTVQFNHTGIFHLTRDGTAAGSAVVLEDRIQVVHTAGHTVFHSENTYTQGTFLNGGILEVSHNNQLGAIGSALHFGGGTLRYAESGTLDLARSVVFDSGTAIFETTGGGTISLHSTLDGASIVKTGSGQLNIFTDANPALSSLSVSDIGSSVVFSHTGTINHLTLNNGGMVSFVGGMTIHHVNGTGTISGEGSIISLGGGELQGTIQHTNSGIIQTTGGNLTIYGSIHAGQLIVGGHLGLLGDGQLTVGSLLVNFSALLEVDGTVSSVLDVAGRLTLSGKSLHVTGNVSPTISGTLTLQSGGELFLGYEYSNLHLDGTIDIGADPDEAPDDPGTISRSTSPGTTAAISGGANAVINFNHTSDDFSFDMPIGGQTKVELYAGTTQLTKANSYTGQTVLNTELSILKLGHSQALEGTARVLIVEGLFDLNGFSATIHGLSSGGGSGGSVFMNNADLTINSTALSSYYAGRISGNGTLVKTGALDLVLAGANDYSGGTVVRNGDLVVSGASAAISHTAVDLIVGQQAADNAHFRIHHEGHAVVRDAIIGEGAASTGQIEINGEGSLLETEKLISGVHGHGSITVIAGGRILASGETILAQESGSTGHLMLIADGVLETPLITQGAGNATLVSNGGVLRATADESNFLRVGDGMHINEDGLTVDTAAYEIGIQSASSMLSGAGGLTKTGVGTLLISGEHTYEGNTTVASGTLILAQGSQIGSAASKNLVAGGASLGGSGALLGDLDVLGGLLSPGESVGWLTIGGDLSLGGIVKIELASLEFFDQIIGLGGDVTIGGTLLIDFLDGFLPEINDAFQIFSGFATISGSFSGIDFSTPGYAGSFDSSTGVLSIVSIPEPSIWQMLLVFAGAAFFASRRCLMKAV